MSAGKAVVLALVVVATALAGCADDATPAAQNEPVSKGTTSSGSPSTSVETPPPPKPKGTSERWHFHDYWKGNPTITLADLVVNLTPGQGADGLPAVGAIVELPHGVIVPPETGFLTLNVTWEGPFEGLVNVSYKPADSSEYLPFADIGRLEGIQLPTSESNCDVPHRQLSAWRFNLTMRPGGTPPGVPPSTVHLFVNATIGRPLFIDPPHLNWWRNGETFNIVEAGAGSFSAARASQAGNLTIPPLSPPNTAAPSIPTVASFSAPVRIPVDTGKIVPEGAHAIVAMLNWTSSAPGGKLALEFAEQNYPSTGPLTLAVDGENSRIFVLAVAQAQTDTTYSNRTTWEFRVVPEGDPAAFHGDFTLVAWVSQLQPDAALALLRPT